MNRNYSKELDSNGALRGGHAKIKGLLADASSMLSAGDFRQLAYIYEDIASLASSLRESAELREQDHDDRLRAVRESEEIMQEAERQWRAMKEVK